MNEQTNKMTPGPWKASEYDFMVVDRRGIPIADCSVGYQKKTDEKMEANARAIAALPELIEALREAKVALAEISAASRRYFEEQDLPDCLLYDDTYVDPLDRAKKAMDAIDAILPGDD